MLGLTGLPSIGSLRDALAAGVARTLGHREAVLAPTTSAAHAGALPDGYGVTLTVGTGVGCLAVDPATATIHRVDGWGDLHGDDGSASRSAAPASPPCCGRSTGAARRRP